MNFYFEDCWNYICEILGYYSEDEDDSEEDSEEDIF